MIKFLLTPWTRTLIPVRSAQTGFPWKSVTLCNCARLLAGDAALTNPTRRIRLRGRGWHTVFVSDQPSIVFCGRLI
jgi:hypothetical protein